MKKYHQLLNHLFVYMMRYIDAISEGLYYSFDAYIAARTSIKGNKYFLINSDGTKQECLLDYFPLPNYRDMRALVELGRGKELYWKEVPMKYLKRR